MPRPTKPRWVEFVPDVTYFKPAGIPMTDLEEVTLGVDEFEAVRLKDFLALEQEECATRMNLAQSTFQRIISQARFKVAQAIVEGKAIRIEGGDFVVSPRGFVCQDCTYEWVSEGKAGTEPSCPSCGGEKIDVYRRVPAGQFRGPGSRGKRTRGRHRGGGGFGRGPDRNL